MRINLNVHIVAQSKQNDKTTWVNPCFFVAKLVLLNVLIAEKTQNSAKNGITNFFSMFFCCEKLVFGGVREITALNNNGRKRGAVDQKEISGFC